jgi:hypothetical protein
MGLTPCLLYTILCVVFEVRVINLCDHDIAIEAESLVQNSGKILVAGEISAFMLDIQMGIS